MHELLGHTTSITDAGEGHIMRLSQLTVLKDEIVAGLFRDAKP